MTQITKSFTEPTKLNYSSDYKGYSIYTKYSDRFTNKYVTAIHCFGEKTLWAKDLKWIKIKIDRIVNS